MKWRHELIAIKRYVLVVPPKRYTTLGVDFPVKYYLRFVYRKLAENTLMYRFMADLKCVTQTIFAHKHYSNCGI